MTTHGFTCCCTATEIGYFSGEETLETLRKVRTEGITIATQRTNQPMYEKLLKAGYVDVGYYNGHSGNIHLLVRGLNKSEKKPKGLTKLRARSKAGRQ